MALDPDDPKEGERDFARALREEVDRVRSAERSAQRAVEELGRARQRLEALVGAGLAGPEPEDRPGVGKADEVVADDVVADDPPDSTFVLVLTGMLVVLLVAAGAGWFILQERTSDPARPAITDGSGAVADVESGEEEAAPEPEAERVVEAPAPTEPPAAEPTFAIPDEPQDRAILYDSLFEARSELFHPLLDSLTAATRTEEVEDAARAWRDGGFLGPLAADRLHSALLQLVLRRETGASLSLDGQVLRNPCRGASCGALLELWESDGERLGLPEMPEDVARSTAVLEMAERVLLLHALGG